MIPLMHSQYAHKIFIVVKTTEPRLKLLLEMIKYSVLKRLVKTITTWDCVSDCFVSDCFFVRFHTFPDCFE